MHSNVGESLKLSIFGESHGKEIGMTLLGIPAGLTVDMDALNAFLQRRAPGASPLSTARKEADVPIFQSGITGNATNGEPLTAVIYNQDVRPDDYANVLDHPRPGHADYTQYVKYGYISSGGGHLSGRLTAPMCIAGGLCKQWLAEEGISVEANILSIGKCTDSACFEKEIAAAKEMGDSVGGVIECIVDGLPAGLGDPIFGGMENRISQMVFGIPAIKGIEFGSGFGGSQMYGSENNDSFFVENGKIRTKTNHAGGILGGITTGMPLIFRVAVKPTPSIAKPQDSISLRRMEPQIIEIKGRHDPCIVPRAVPVVEAAAAIAIMDAMLGQRSF